MKMRGVFAGLVGLLFATQALAQAQVGAGQVLGNSSATLRPARSETVTSILDRALGSTQNRLLYRGATAWEALASANNGVLVTSAGGAPSISSTLPSGLSATNMSLVTPSIGVATGTSLALNGAAIGSHRLAVTGTSALSDSVFINNTSPQLNEKLRVTGATVGTGVDTFPLFVEGNAPQGQAGFLVFNSASNHIDNRSFFGLQAQTTAGRNSVFSFSAKFSDVNDATRTSAVSMLVAVNGSTQNAAQIAGQDFTFFGAAKSNSPTAGVGYATGSGGSVTQGVSRTTGVTLDKVSGAITLFSAAGSASFQSFTVTNSTVAVTDTVIINQRSGTDLYETHITAVAAGSFRVTYRTTGGTTVEQPVFNFSIIKGTAS
jgi:hypothetical protein